MHGLSNIKNNAVLSGLSALLLISLILFFAILGNYFYKKTGLLGKPDNVRDSFTLTGIGEATAIPDVAILHAGLETTLKTVGEAQSQNTRAMNQFLAKVKGLGIKDEDRKTINYGISPKYDYSTDGSGNSKNELAGYTVFNQVELKVRDFSKIQEIMALFGQYGLNQVGSLTFKVDDDAHIRQTALQEALVNAREKAESTARSGKFRLGRLVSFNESAPDGPMSPYYSIRESKDGAASAQQAPTVERGSQEVRMTVSATFEILP